MPDRVERTRMLLGEAAMDRLARSRVAVFGLGGVGGYAVEALARSGIGALDLIDGDAVALSNMNRQILATEATVGLDKVAAASARVISINPCCRVRTYRLFYLPGEDGYDFAGCDYLADAVDTVAAKLALAESARAAGIPIISAMGTGNQLDPAQLRVSDISKTSVCPLARVMRRELKKRGIDHLKVVWSPEEPIAPEKPEDEVPPEGRRSIPGSTAFVPAAAGLLMASEIVRDLIGRDK